MKKETIIRNMQNSSFRDNEDVPVIDYINSINNGQEITLLEVGSGECRFVRKIMNLYSNVRITCIEINPDLGKIAEDLGCNVFVDNVLNVQINEKYDIVHCSHVIEHFDYPAITEVLDFLCTHVSANGRLIIRTPLLWEAFYYDIDHIRIYPPYAIINYFNYNQQQKKSKHNIIIEKIWYRTIPRRIEHISTWHLVYAFKLTRRMINVIIDKINILYEKLWNRYRWPSSKPNGYVAIIKCY